MVIYMRRQGFCPILLMDANGDPYTEKGKDKDLADFIEKAQLCDPFHEMHPGQIRTFLYGNKCLDFALVDLALKPCVKRAGYLGTHAAGESDHGMPFLDLDRRMAFAGIINRPLPISHRSF